MKRFYLVMFLLGFFAIPVMAQTQTVAPNTPIKVDWDYDAPTGTNFSIVVDGAIHKNFGSQELTLGQPNMTAGTWPYSATMPGLPPGKGRKVKLRAYIGTDPTQLFAETPEILVDVLPTVPRNFRMTISAAPSGDAVQIELRGAENPDGTPASIVTLKFPSVVPTLPVR